MPADSTLVLLERLAADPAVHGRARVNQQTVRRYAQVAGDPQRPNQSTPVDVFRDGENRLWLADGFLRCYGSRAAGHRSIRAFIRDGSRRDAVLFACGANAQHGLPLRQLDKRKATASLLISPEFAGESDAEIARRAGVSRALVAELRPHCGSQEQYDRFVDEAKFQKFLRNRAYKVAQGTDHAADMARINLREAGLPVPPDPTERTTSAPEAPASEHEAVESEAPALDSPLTPREEAMRLLARASAATSRAKRAMAEAQAAYPEALHFPALAAVVEARGQLEDLLPEEAKTAHPGGVNPREVLSTMGELCGVKPDLRDVAMVPFSVLPDPNAPPKTIFDTPVRKTGRQPETLHPSDRGKTITEWIAKRAQARGSPPFD